MKAELALDLVGRYVLIIFAIAIGIAIFTTLITDIGLFPTEEESGYEKSRICQQYGYMQDIDSEQLREIISARYHMSCQKDRNILITEQIISKTVLEDIAIEENILGSENDPKIVYRPECERMKGFEGLIVEHENPDEDIVFDEGKTINVTESDQAVKICEK